MAQYVIFRFVSLQGWSELLDPLICYEVFFFFESPLAVN